MRHNILIPCHGNNMQMKKKIPFMLEIDISKNSCFLRVRVAKRRLDALLAKTLMAPTLYAFTIMMNSLLYLFNHNIFRKYLKE